MSVFTDIAATYRGPGAVMRRLMSEGVREDRVLAFLMGGCALMFIAQWPRLAREAHLTGTDLQMSMGGALLGIVFMLPLIMYGLAALGQLAMRLLGRPVGGFNARLALFWTLLASAPLLLLHGLVAGFVGPGPALQLVGLAWLATFGWFWIASLRTAGQEAA